MVKLVRNYTTYQKAGDPFTSAIWQSKDVRGQGGGGAVAGGDDPVDSRVQQAVGHSVAKAVAPTKVCQVNL